MSETLVERLRRIVETADYPGWVIGADGLRLSDVEKAADEITRLQEVTSVAEEMAGEIGFLLARINEIDWSLEPDDFANQWFGHVDPPVSRTGAILSRYREVVGNG